MPNSILFLFEDVELEVPLSEQLKLTLEGICIDFSRTIDYIQIIFCSDEHLLGINKQFLDHDYYTDILTFAYSDNPVEAELFLSVDRIKENAKEYHVSFHHELYRVIIHGVLHIMGFADKNEDLKKEMTKAEDLYLSKLMKK